MVKATKFLEVAFGSVIVGASGSILPSSSFLLHSFPKRKEKVRMKNEE
jgi:hypothetical protein